MSSTINASTASGGGVITTADASGILQLQTAGVTGLTIDASQNVGIGTSSPAQKLTVSATTATQGIVSTTTGNAAYLVLQNSADSSNAYVYATGKELRLSQADTSASSIVTISTQNTERMRIDSSGNLLVGTTAVSTAPTTGFTFNPQTIGAYAAIGHSSSAGSGSYFISFGYNGGVIGTITQNGTTGVLYNLTSDYRLKDNPTALTGASDFIMALQPKTWDWWDGSGKGVGFIAHEFMDVAKHSGNGVKDEVDVEGNPIYQSIQPSSSEVMANLVALVQELKAIIDTQNARIEALEAK